MNELHYLDENVLPILYMLAAAGFILAIKWMNSPATARRGVIVGEIGMLLAVVGTLLRFEVVTYQWIFIAFFRRPFFARRNNGRIVRQTQIVLLDLLSGAE